MSLNFLNPITINGATQDSSSLNFFAENTFYLNGGYSPQYQNVTVSGNNEVNLVNAKANGLNYLKAFGACEQKGVLPSGYTQTEYTSNNNGGTYINTGYKPRVDNFEMEIKVMPSTDSWYIFQSRYSTSSGQTGILGANSGSTIGIGFNGEIGTSSIIRDTTHIYIINAKYKNGTGTLHVKDETTGDEDTQTITYTFSAVLKNIGLFGNTTGQGVKAGNKIYYAWLKSEDEYVLNYIPCIYNGVSGFYDTVTSSFVGATTGTFTAEGTAVPIPTSPINIKCNNGEIKSPNLYNIATMYTITNVSLANNYGDDKIFYAGTGSRSVVMPCIENTNYILSLGGELQGSIFRVATTERLLTTSDNSSNPYTACAINRTPVNDKLTINSGLGAKYMYIQFSSANISNMLSILQVQIGTTATPYTRYKRIYADGTAETVGVNYFDSSTMIVTKYGIRTTASETVPVGGEQSNAGYNCSTYIAVSPKTQYTTILPKSSTASFLGLVYYSSNTVESAISGVSLLTQGSETYTFTTPATCNYIRFTWSNTKGNNVKLIKTGNTATAQNLFSIDDIADTQEILTGAITKRTGVLVFDGTENWASSNGAFNLSDVATNVLYGSTYPCICTHYIGGVPSQSVAAMPDLSCKVGANSASIRNRLYIKDTRFSGTTAFKNFLANEFAKGTPVIMVYPKDENETESTTPQHLTIQKGANTIEITQASIDPLKLEAQYKAGVEVTIEEVQNANLDNSVVVTIGE